MTADTKSRTSASSLVQRLEVLGTCILSDALDTLSLPGAVLGLRPLWPNVGVTVGTARTIQAGPRRADGPTTHIATPLVAQANPGDVVVIANGGREDVSCFGGILAHAARARGIGGIVIDGACRDIEESEQLNLPMYGRSVVQVSARGRIVQEDMDVPIVVAGVTVTPGDYVIADRCGVVFVAAADVERVVALGERIARREEEMVSKVTAGQSVVDVMHDSQFPKAES
jgi:regulator of RNase E activity RraA